MLTARGHQLTDVLHLLATWSVGDAPTRCATSCAVPPSRSAGGAPDATANPTRTTTSTTCEPQDLPTTPRCAISAAVVRPWPVIATDRTGGRDGPGVNVHLGVKSQ